MTRAEVKVTNLLIQYNVPLSVADHLFKDVFSDSEITKSCSSAGTKTACILNGAIAPHSKSALVARMRTAPFSVAIDGSNDNGLEKLNPLTVKMDETFVNNGISWGQCVHAGVDKLFC